MTTTQISAVPPPMPATFRERGMAALEMHQGQDLVSFLATIHDQAMAEVVEQAASARGSVLEMAADARVNQQMLSSALESIRPLLRVSAENATRASHWSAMLEAVRGLVREAEHSGNAVDPDALNRVLTTAGQPPVFRPQAVAFVPSTQYRVGHFRHVQTDVRVSHPFSGFMACTEAPDRPMTVHLAFLHGGVVKGRPQLYAEHGLAMEHLE